VCLHLYERFDPETVRGIMSGCFAALTVEIERYEGTVNAFMGDGLMVLFGAPVGDEVPRHGQCAPRASSGAWFAICRPPARFSTLPDAPRARCSAPSFTAAVRTY
jgi:class 3 adenylate cyclase